MFAFEHSVVNQISYTLVRVSAGYGYRGGEDDLWIIWIPSDVPLEEPGAAGDRVIIGLGVRDTGSTGEKM